MSFADRDLDNSFDKELRDKNSILTLDFMLPAIVLVLPCGVVSGLHFMFKRECLINSELILCSGTGYVRNSSLAGVLSTSPRKLVEFCWALSSGLLSPSTNTITNFTNAAKYEFEQHSVLRDTLEPAVSLFVFYLASTTLLEKYEFKQRPVLIDALEPEVSLFVFYPVSTSLLEGHRLGAIRFVSISTSLRKVVEFCGLLSVCAGSQTWSNKICVNDAFDKMHWSLSTTLMKLVGILVEVYFYLLPAPLLYQYSCFVCSFISISFSASDSLTQQLLILCRYFSRWLCLHQDYTKCFLSFSFTF
ncbi:hypothetical protein POTOM_008165 [Populus tomentosa]|uniref:Uncharacterized protein n=1 Tax=Populus tomentosa TaxID=118781 RepID=A0A8X8DDY4_POPTO|nr:hypothetical protein POTOM_008165 [Populus tomentosa]